MSYTVYVTCPKCSNCGREFFEDVASGVTWNIMPMYRLAGLEFRTLDGETGRDALVRIEAALEKMKREPEKYRALNPSNGWGSYEGAVEVLERFAEVCREMPDGIVDVH